MHPIVRRLAPPTTDSVDGDGFLALGAAVGTVGWTGTWALALWDGPSAPAAAAALWLALVAVMGTVGGTRTPDAVRFSRPLSVWGATNTTATLVSLVAVARPGSVPATGVLAAWFGSFLAGYAATARFVGSPDARPYRVGAALALAGLAALLVGAGGVSEGGRTTISHWYLAAGVVHVLPLVLAVRR